jgi:hypothetical protein
MGGEPTITKTTTTHTKKVVFYHHKTGLSRSRPAAALQQQRGTRRGPDVNAWEDLHACPGTKIAGTGCAIAFGVVAAAAVVVVVVVPSSLSSLSSSSSSSSSLFAV